MKVFRLVAISLWTPMDLSFRLYLGPKSLPKLNVSSDAKAICCHLLVRFWNFTEPKGLWRLTVVWWGFGIGSRWMVLVLIIIWRPMAWSYNPMESHGVTWTNLKTKWALAGTRRCFSVNLILFRLGQDHFKGVLQPTGLGRWGVLGMYIICCILILIYRPFPIHVPSFVQLGRFLINDHTGWKCWWTCSSSTWYTIFIWGMMIQEWVITLSTTFATWQSLYIYIFFPFSA